MDRDRRLAFLILKDIETGHAWSNLAVKEKLASQGADRPAFLRELVYGCIRNQILLDYNVRRFLSRPKLSAAEKVLLRMGFYQLAMMDSVQDHAAINETVSLASAFIRGRQGFINAVLRSFQRDGKRLIYDCLSTRYSCAEWIIKLWEKSYGKEKTEELLAAGNTPAPFTIRVNTLKTDRSSLSKELKRLGYEVSECSGSALCLQIKGSGLLDTELYKEGLFSVQGESSCRAVELLAPAEGEMLLDLCAAPGGKSCAAAELMKNRGKIMSFDIYEHRTELIKKEAARLGIGIIDAVSNDSSVFDPALDNKADCVIADVPCSGLGTIRRNPEIKITGRSAEESSRILDELCKIQYNILVNALKYVKKGGRVLYSTCTIDPAENGDLVRKVLSDVGGHYIESEEQVFIQAGGPDGFYTCIIRRVDDKRRF